VQHVLLFSVFLKGPTMSDHDSKTHPHPADERDANRDPITDAPGAHPVGSGLGAAAGGAAAGAAGGAVAGPVGAVAGAIIGGLVGGLAGKGVAEYIDPTDEEAYWREEHRNREYTVDDRDYDHHYRPAYQYGWESYQQHNKKDDDVASARRFEDVEPDLRRDWESHRTDQDLTWDEARPAAADAYNRVHERRTAGEL
jgi:hypothetical protein